MRHPVLVVEYDPQWPTRYAEEEAHILEALTERVVAIEHVGSTAVPGLGAKPIIDIMVAIRRLDLVEECIEPLGRLHYEYLGEYGIPDRHYFRKPPELKSAIRTHHLHMVEFSSDFWERHLLFRDYLRTHPQTAQEYYNLKKALSLRYVSNRAAYTDAKTEFIESAIARARTLAAGKVKST